MFYQWNFFADQRREAIYLKKTRNTIISWEPIVGEVSVAIQE